MIIGIDLGTTNSLVAHFGTGGPQIVPNALGDNLTPSVVGLDVDGVILVGKPAKELQVSHPIRCASVFKRHMGTDWTVVLGEGKTTRRFSAVELSSIVLKSLKQDAEADLKQEITEAVITVPAYFNELQRQATIQAGELAGFTVRRIINEPTAAAIAYGLNDSQSERVSLVFDLGGGTFDVSIIDQFDGTLEIRASAGETFLGGEDFTNAMVSRILRARGKNFEHVELEFPALVSRLRAECENGKRQLATADSVEVRIPDNDGNLSEDCETDVLTREEFNEWTHKLLSRVEIPIRRSLGDSGLQRKDIDSLILVGGATRMRSVVDYVTKLFGKSPQCDLNPDHVVAMGAAVQAGLVDRNESLGDVVVTDVAPFTLGVEIVRSMAGRDHAGYFQPIISRNTTIPVSRVERFGTAQANQTHIEVRLYQGEGRKVEDNLLLGQFSVRGITPGPVGQPIDLRFTYDLNGILEVEATIVESGKTVKHLVTQHAQGLSKKQIQAAVSAMEKLKTHPRELTQNRYLLKRAERLFSEMPQSERDILELLLSGFEESLELQDPAAIDRNRAALQQYLSAFDAFPDEDTEL